MLPFHVPAWKEKVRRLHKQTKDEDEELAERMREHDYSECYCNALMNPPWGGYSKDEQILHEIKQCKKGGGQGKHQVTGTSSYTYLNRDQAAILGDAAILQTTKLHPNLFSKIGTTHSEHARTSKVAPAHTTSTRLEDLPNEILCNIISYLDPPELGTLSEASRRFTILVGPVPCGNPFIWARHRCLIHGHARRTALCGDCIAALIARNNRSICKQDHASWVGDWQFL